MLERSIFHQNAQADIHFKKHKNTQARVRLGLFDNLLTEREAVPLGM